MAQIAAGLEARVRRIIRNIVNFSAVQITHRGNICVPKKKTDYVARGIVGTLKIVNSTIIPLITIQLNPQRSISTLSWLHKRLVNISILLHGSCHPSSRIFLPTIS